MLTSNLHLVAQHSHLGCGMLQVMSLRPRFQAAAQSEGASEDDIEAIKGMARLFAELGESYVGLLAQGVCRAERGIASSVWIVIVYHETWPTQLASDWMCVHA